MKKILLPLALIAGLFSSPALADWTGRDALNATITFKNPGLCTSVVCVPVAQLYDGTNVVTLTTAGADGASNSLVGVPVYSRNVLWNGTTWDRWTGDLTNGGWVNVKTSVLPTGAATAAKQPALGTAGTASTDVLTVQGIASMTPFLANPGTAANWGVGPSTQNSATVANGQLALGQFNTTPTTITSGNMSPLQMDNAGNLLVNIKAGAAAGGTSSNFGSAFPAAGTAVGFTDGTNMAAGRVGAVANLAAATNFLDALGICQYNATPLTVTDTRYQSVQCDVNGFLKVNVTNTNANITPGDAIATGTYAAASPTIGSPLLWNGTTYDRLKSVATGVAAVGGTGTAGTAATNVLTVQGIASMTPLLSNPGTAANWGIGATAAAVPANAGYFGFNSGGNLTGVSSSAPLPTRSGDGTRQAVLDPCEANAQTSAPISITTATTTRIVAPSASNKTYICYLFVTSAAADNVGIVEGTGGTCGTGTAGVIGGTTSTNGPNFAANGGVSLSAGGKTAVAYTAGTNVDLCLITSAATPLAGVIKYVQAP